MMGLAIDRYEHARMNMVEGQIRPNNVTDKALITAMLHVPREVFVPQPVQACAYIDDSLPLGRGRFLSEPRVLARLLQAAAPQSHERALVIGAGSGYSAALLAEITAEVIGVEADEAFLAEARQNLAHLGLKNAHFYANPLKDGYPVAGPYALILIDGAVMDITAAILNQLAEGGRLVTVFLSAKEGRPIKGGQATLITRYGTIFARRILFDADLPVLPEFVPKAGFVF
jgi:protein-L-isoaspartate(D-aspartate) O-methyltransferase